MNNVIKYECGGSLRSGNASTLVVQCPSADLVATLLEYLGSPDARTPELVLSSWRASDRGGDPLTADGWMEVAFEGLPAESVAASVIDAPLKWQWHGGSQTVTVSGALKWKESGKPVRNKNCLPTMLVPSVSGTLAGLRSSFGLDALVLYLGHTNETAFLGGLPGTVLLPTFEAAQKTINGSLCTTLALPITWMPMGWDWAYNEDTGYWEELCNQDGDPLYPRAELNDLLTA